MKERHKSDNSGVHAGSARSKTHAGAKSLTSSHEALVGLQRSAGNSAVVSMLQSGSDTVVQRDVGFEFESRWTMPRLLPSKLRSKKKRTAPPKDKRAWHQQFDSLPKENLSKGDKLMTGPGVNLTVDDSGGDRDCEFVTKAFPETDSGENELDAALTAMDGFETRIQQHTGDYAPMFSELRGGAFKVSRSNTALKPADYSGGFVGAPQMTIGLGLGDIPRVINDLIGVRGNEPAHLTQARQPGRQIVRPGRNAAPTRGGAGGLVDGLELAKQAIANFAATPQVPVPQAPPKPFNHATGASNELRGLLTLIYSIMETAKTGTSTYLKMCSDLLAKTNYGTLYRQLPTKEFLYFRENGGDKFKDLVESAPGYQGNMNRPVFDRPAHHKYHYEMSDDNEWYLTLTREAWIKAMTNGKDLLTTANFPQLPPGTELEGFGTLGSKMDRVGTRDLPIFELRSFSAVPGWTLSQFHPVALKLFKYIRSVNLGAPQRIT